MDCVILGLIIFPTWAIENGKSISMTSSILSQRLAEAAEDADLYHDYNETLEVSENRPQYKNIYLYAVCYF